MKKSSFVALLFGMAGGVLFALGMCMVLLSEWDMFRPGIGFGCVGILLGGVAVVVWRKMEKKAPILCRCHSRDGSFGLGSGDVL